MFGKFSLRENHAFRKSIHEKVNVHFLSSGKSICTFSCIYSKWCAHVHAHYYVQNTEFFRCHTFWTQKNRLRNEVLKLLPSQMESKLASSIPAINWIAVLCSPVSIQEIFPKKIIYPLNLFCPWCWMGKARGRSSIWNFYWKSTNLWEMLLIKWNSCRGWQAEEFEYLCNKFLWFKWKCLKFVYHSVFL